MHIHKQNILNLKDGEVYFLDLGEESGAEVWKKNDLYFLFDIPQYGGTPTYCGHFNVLNIDDAIKNVLSWT